VSAAVAAAEGALRDWRSVPRPARVEAALAMARALEADTGLAARYEQRFGLVQADWSGHCTGLREGIGRALERPREEDFGLSWHAPDWRELLRTPMLELALALASGATIVFVADPRLPELGAAFARAAHAGGLPPGLVNVLHGARWELVARGLNASRARGLSASGTVEFMAELRRLEGNHEARLRALRSGAYEVSVNRALEESAEEVVRQAFGRGTLGGQLVGALARVHCSSRLFSRFTELFLRRLEVHGPLVPLIDAEAAARARAAFELGIDEGATCIAGGDGEGLCFPATVFTNVELYMASAKRQEPLPVVCLLREP
jgi:acyl-CoA reductase-like NAD-dependent aldehyde dehydrogenase